MQITNLCPELFVAVAQNLDPQGCLDFTHSCLAFHGVAREIEQDLILRSPHVLTRALATCPEIPESLDYDLDRIAGRLGELRIESPVTTDAARLQTLLRTATRIETLYLIAAPQISNETLRMAGSFRFIRELCLKEHPTADNETLNAFSGLPLEKLHLESLPFVVGIDCVATAIRVHTKLTSLTLIGIPQFYDDTIEQLTSLTKLADLTCSSMDIVDVGFSVAARMTHLTSLAVSTLESLTNTIVEPLRNHPKLEQLDLSNSLLLSSIVAPATIQNLRVLDLTRCTSILDGDFAPLRNHPNLAVIKVSGCQEVSFRACEVFASIPGLVELYLRNCPKLEDEDLGYFSHNTRLQIVDLSKTRINGSGLGWLAKIHSLTTLYLNNVSKLQTGSINVFRAHPSLEAVSVIGTRMLSGNEVKALLKCPRFKTMSMNAEYATQLINRYPRRLIFL